jgi:hypothetical protein
MIHTQVARRNRRPACNTTVLLADRAETLAGTVQQLREQDISLGSHLGTRGRIMLDFPNQLTSESVLCGEPTIRFLQADLLQSSLFPQEKIGVLRYAVFPNAVHGIKIHLVSEHAADIFGTLSNTA